MFGAQWVGNMLNHFVPCTVLRERGTQINLAYIETIKDPDVQGALLEPGNKDIYLVVPVRPISGAGM